VLLGVPILSHLRSENRLTESTGCPGGKRSVTRVVRDSKFARNREAGQASGEKTEGGVRRNASRAPNRKVQARTRDTRYLWNFEPSTATCGKYGHARVSLRAAGVTRS